MWQGRTGADHDSAALGLAYAVGSVVLGPAVFLLGCALFTRGGGDLCDSIYRLADGSFAADRDREFRDAQLFQVIGASVMLLAGAAILATLAHHRAKSSSRIVSVLAAVATADWNGAPHLAAGRVRGAAVLIDE